MILGCCVVTLASHDSLTLFANSLVFIGFHLLLSGSQDYATHYQCLNGGL